MQFAHNGYYKGSIPFGLIIRRLYFVALPLPPPGEGGEGGEGGFCSAWLAEWLRLTILRGRRQRPEAEAGGRGRSHCSPLFFFIGR